MADQRDGGIAWTDQTWNPTRGCRRVAPECENCYAETQAARFAGQGQPYEGLISVGKNGPRWNGEGRLIPEHLADPLRWRRPRLVFVDSMSDLFHEAFSNEDIAAVFGVMAAAQQHTFQVLTKRPARMREWFEWVTTDRHVGPVDYCDEVAVQKMAGHFDACHLNTDGTPWPLPNVWLGVSAGSQPTADRWIPELLATPAAVRFLSAEPLIGPLNLRHLDADAAGHKDWCQIDALTGRHTDMGRPCRDVPRLDWVIVGGESGRDARPMDLAWARDIVRQCQDAGVPVFVKQLGARPWGPDFDGEHARLCLRDKKGGDPDEWPEDLRVRQFPVVR